MDLALEVSSVIRVLRWTETDLREASISTSETRAGACQSSSRALAMRRWPAGPE